MKRVETYVGQQVYEWLFSAQAQNEMVALGKLSAAMLGTNVIANGLACTPTSPASMTVQIGPGELYQMESLEATVCGTLPQDTTHQILKQGIQLGTYTTTTFAAPSTSGQSINYLIEAQYQDSDISIDPTTGASPVVLQFYDANNPSQPWSGPNNGGATSNTFRDGVIAYQIKAGVAATTGTQTTPLPDANWTGLWVVTVPYGASSLTSTNIAAYPGAPVLPTGLLQSIITGNLNYGIDSGTANAIQATFPVPVTTLTDGMFAWVKVKNANTGATTFTPNPGVISASPVVGAAHAALQGGEYVANGRALHVWRQDISSWVLAFCTGGADQVAPATQTQHCPQAGQIQRNAFNYAGLAGGTANAITATLNPAPASYTDYLLVTVRVASTNTSSVSLNVNGLGAVPVIGQGHQTLQGGELVAGGFATFAYSLNFSEAILLEATGGPVQVGAATASQHAVQFGQVSGVAGSVRKLIATLATAGTSISYTADEIIVESAIGGLRYCLANFSKTLNGATTGLGGLDTGSLAANTFYAIYAAYTSGGVQGIFAQAEPGGGATSTYQGSFLPSGVIATALIGVWPTNGSSQFVAGYQRGGKFKYQAQQTVLNGGTATGATAVSTSTVVPNCALDVMIRIQALNVTTNSSGAASIQTFIEIVSSIVFEQFGYTVGNAGASNFVSWGGPLVEIPNVGRQYYYANTVSSGSAGAVTHAVDGYRLPIGGE